MKTTASKSSAWMWWTKNWRISSKMRHFAVLKGILRKKAYFRSWKMVVLPDPNPPEQPGATIGQTIREWSRYSPAGRMDLSLCLRTSASSQRLSLLKILENWIFLPFFHNIGFFLTGHRRDFSAALQHKPPGQKRFRQIASEEPSWDGDQTFRAIHNNLLQRRGMAPAQPLGATGFDSGRPFAIEGQCVGIHFLDIGITATKSRVLHRYRDAQGHK